MAPNSIFHRRAWMIGKASPSPAHGKVIRNVPGGAAAAASAVLTAGLTCTVPVRKGNGTKSGHRYILPLHNTRNHARYL